LIFLKNDGFLLDDSLLNNKITIMNADPTMSNDEILDKIIK